MSNLDVQMMCGKNTKVLCFPNDMVNNLKERILQIADEYPTVTNIVLHTGSNDVSKQQSEVLKRDFTGLLNTVNSLNAAVFISGPVPPVRGGDERFSRLFALNKWLISACTGRRFDPRALCPGRCYNNCSLPPPM
uniref:SGNH hydrolase-type esterase domain-containing protein n=1 Tax=Astatotilapia calliptera TaxID=8154 RepID=A0AAX7SHC5_ASTCA